MSHDDSANPADNRKEHRYPGVGIRLLYSPADDTVLDNLAEILCHATMIDMSLAGIAFDVTSPMKTGAQLVVLVHGFNDKPTEQLITEVCWQVRLGKNHFRIGTKILSSKLLEDDADIEDIDDIQVGMDFPAGIAIQCPACDGDAMFNLSGIQPLTTGPTGFIPLYDCSHCGTTRTITSILAHHRQTCASSSD